jgi:hypothetical protein
MTNDQIKITAQIEKERKKIFNRDRKCFYPFCEKYAIDSHVLQKNGFISKISNDNHVYEYKYFPFREQSFGFKRTGINEVFTFKGFCSYHDNYLFKEIENGILDFSDYRKNLIFGYRVIAQEFVKKKEVIEWFSAIISKNLTKNAVNNVKLRANISGQRLGINDSFFLLKKVTDNINNPSLKDFNFHTRTIDYLDICASGVYSYETTKEQMQMTDEDYMKPLTDIFVNILPVNNKTIVTMGYLNSNNLNCNAYIENKFLLPQDKFIKFLSDILLAQMENWIISSSFYDKIKNDERIITKVIKKANRTLNERFSIEYNLFK